MKKMDHYKAVIAENLACLCCPKCGARFALADGALLCDNRHRFDIAAKGYINFMTGAKVAAEHYDDALFESRAAVFQKGFFAPLLSEIAGIIAQYSEKAGIIADIGCGEGSALSDLTEKTGAAGVGLDLSKQGIAAAARRGLSDAIWIVGDLTRLPLKNGGADVLLNMLSPAHYQEFDRAVKAGGLIIKILPGENYLRQLRTYFYKGSDKEFYSNERTADYFKAHYPGCAEKEIGYTVAADEAFLYHIARMSPLSSEKGANAATLFSQSGAKEITAEFKILIGNAL
ncbi:MAG: methyltransferase domain-containing protein [Clostridiales bacterium]|nr:methyltransferase domain-containing protein [Clostridiales bacterium]